MFSSLFRKCKEDINPLPPSPLLNQNLEMLEEKENALQKKISTEVERAKHFTRTKNKQAALQCLKRKKFYEAQMEHLESYQLRIIDQGGKPPQKLSGQCGHVQQVKSNVKNS
ncbi:vacuolar protein sorting-associated protein 32 homolog 2-like [Tasmannia lanceolata]|uniref:vacuolar protein sorting-associated protein 32 homolog 2-like n=1 Tax=Tasmannia lanceolata TaxID=3420 RepID=UPI0040643607